MVEANAMPADWGNFELDAPTRQRTVGQDVRLTESEGCVLEEWRRLMMCPACRKSALQSSDETCLVFCLPQVYCSAFLRRAFL